MLVPNTSKRLPWRIIQIPIYRRRVTTLSPVIVLVMTLAFLGCQPAPTPPAASTKPTTLPNPNERARAYLDELVRKSQEPEGGVRFYFYGDFLGLPAEMVVSLSEAFPRYRFLPAHMEFLHFGPEPLNILLVTDTDTGEVICQCWEIWFTGTDTKFNRFLQRFRPRDRKEAAFMFGQLANAITFISRGRADEVVDDGKVLSSGLRTHHEGIWRVLQVPLSDDLKFGEMSFEMPPPRKY